jgi:hypothetical protein
MAWETISRAPTQHMRLSTAVQPATADDVSVCLHATDDEAIGAPRGDFKAWRDKLAVKSQRQADYAWTVLQRVLSVANSAFPLTLSSLPSRRPAFR